MPVRVSSSVFIPTLRLTLSHLYDPNYLRASKLTELLGIPEPADRVATLRKILQGSIEATHPDPKAPLDSNPKRIHQILFYRFIEQSSQKEVASEMLLSVRQIQRLEAAAIRQLALQLERDYPFAIDWEEESEESDLESAPPADKPSEEAVARPAYELQMEIDWLKRSYPIEPLHLDDLLLPLLKMISPLLETHAVRVDNQTRELIVPFQGNQTALRQALLNVITLIIPALKNGQIHFLPEIQPEWVCLDIEAWPFAGDVAFDQNDNIRVAQQLVEVSKGTMSWSGPDNQDSKFRIQLCFQRAHLPVVFVIDDNEDAQLLFERCLDNTAFRYSGTRDPLAVIPLIEQLRPNIIILDVMLPGQDGWEILSQLRRNAQTENIPIIISTILPQQELALMLGANDFLRKPFTKKELLAVLRHLAA